MNELMFDFDIGAFLVNISDKREHFRGIKAQKDKTCLEKKK